MEFFVFVDVPYYPYVAGSVEADTPDEALGLALGEEGPLPVGGEIYVVPMHAVTRGTMHGPERKPKGLLALMDEQNRLRSERRIAAEDLLGGFTVIVEPGTNQ